jgi:flagellar capping protein FliD
MAAADGANMKVTGHVAKNVLKHAENGTKNSERNRFLMNIPVSFNIAVIIGAAMSAVFAVLMGFTIWILTDLRSSIKDLQSSIKDLQKDVSSIKSEDLPSLKSGQAVLTQRMEDLDKRMDDLDKRFTENTTHFDRRFSELAEVIHQTNQNFIAHLRHDHGIQMGERVAEEKGTDAS